MRSVSMGPPGPHETGHFYFAQTRHSHFAATPRECNLDPWVLACYLEGLFWAQCSYCAPGLPVEGAHELYGPDQTGCPRGAPAQPEEPQSRHPAQQPDRDHRSFRLGKVLARV